MKKHHSFYLRGLFVWSVVLTLALHAIIPVGYMPGFSGHGLFTYCDGTDHAGHMGHAHGGHGHTGPCPFSAGAIFGFAGIKAPLITPPVYAATAEVLLFSSTLRQHLRFSSAQPRSPPLFS